MNVTLTLLHALPTVHYAVQSKVFPQDPSRLFVTSRGDNGSPLASSTTNAGLAVFDIGGPAASRPTLLESWAVDGGKKAVEGLDLCGDLLALVGITDGTLYALNASCVCCGPVGSIKLSTNRALHVRLAFMADDKAPVPWGGCGGGRRGRVYALVTSGFATHLSTQGLFADALMAVDISDPTRAKEVGKLERLPSQPEGIFVHDAHAYVGGCRGSALAVVDLSSLPTLRLSCRVRDPAFVQMVRTRSSHLGFSLRATCHERATSKPSAHCVPQVSTQRGYDDRASTLYFALWGEVGGLLVASAGADGTPHILSRLASAELAKANRVVIHEATGLAVLPLEQKPAKLAFVDVRNASAPRLAAPLLTLPDANRTGPALATLSTTYCAAIDATGGLLYVFAAQAATMYVYAIQQR